MNSQSSFENRMRSPIRIRSLRARGHSRGRRAVRRTETMLCVLSACIGVLQSSHVDSIFLTASHRKVSATFKNTNPVWTVKQQQAFRRTDRPSNLHIRSIGTTVLENQQHQMKRQRRRSKQQHLQECANEAVTTMMDTNNIDRHKTNHKIQQIRPKRANTLAVLTAAALIITMMSAELATKTGARRIGVMAFTSSTFSIGSSSAKFGRQSHRLPVPASLLGVAELIALRQRRSIFTFSHCRHRSSSSSLSALQYPLQQQLSRLMLSTTTSNDNRNDSRDQDDGGFFANDDVTFETIGIRSKVLLERLNSQLGMTRPTQIQAKAFRPILYGTNSIDNEEDEDQQNQSSSPRRRMSRDVTIGAETGCGKTLAYLLPLMDDILHEKEQAASKASDGTTKMPILPSYDYARAIILVPNKELVQQVLRMAVPLAGGTIQQALVWGASGTELLEQLKPLACAKDPNETDPSQIVRMAIMPGGLSDPLDFKPFRESLALGGNEAPVDLVVTTPAALGELGLKPKHIDMFADIRTLVVDEADMLLDGGYIRSLESVLVGFRRADRLDPPVVIQRKGDGDDDTDNNAAATPANTKTQHIFCAATLPDVGLKSVDAYLQRKFPYAVRIETDNMHNAKHYGLVAPTQWYQIETKKERMDRLVKMLTGDEDALDDLRNEKVMVFLNSVEDVEAAHEALAQRGINNVPYHAKISLLDRSRNLDRFRRYQPGDGTDDETVPVLVCTDLASRGLDVPGVTAVVQLQFSGNVVSHLHRMGRCGRAGQRTGRGIVFYSDTEADLVRVVQEAENQQERMELQQDVDELEVPVDGEEEARGKVKTAFSRKRGFTKKRKKLKRQEGEVGV